MFFAHLEQWMKGQTYSATISTGHGAPSQGSNERAWGSPAERLKGPSSR